MMMMRSRISSNNGLIAPVSIGFKRLIHLQDQGIKCAAVDFGGEFISSVSKIIEKAIVTSQKAGIISDSHNEEGAVAGAAREAVSQISQKAIGLNVGGKIAIARFGNHLSVCLYFGIGMLNLNEIAIGLGHRAV